MNKSKTIKNKMIMRKTGAKIRGFLLAVLILAVVTVIFLFLTNRYFFRIQNVGITISENVGYTYEEVLAASGIEIGGELYALDIKKVKANLKEMLTYAETVNVTRTLPSTVNIDIKTEKGFFGIMLGGDYYIVSRHFRVIDKINVVGGITGEPEFKPPEGIITFETDTVKKCYVGEKIEFWDSDIADFLEDIAGLFDNTGNDDAGNIEMLSTISVIDVRNKFKVVMNYSDRFLVKAGVFENISLKILDSFEIINRLPDYAEGVIDMTNSKPASFSYDQNIVKLYKSK